MKKIKKSVKLATFVAALGLGVSSCSLDLLPLNEVVLENFWTDKSDVESVVASCYSQINSGKYLHMIMAWGEGRSDNTVVGPDCPESLRFLMKGGLKTTNEYCDWAELYNVINKCNTVLKYAPTVAEKDPNYTKSDLAVNSAECKALRAMTYFYLIKTFKNVPFTFEPTIDDNSIEQMYAEQKSDTEILDILIADLEGCEMDAIVRYSEYKKTVGRITRPAIDALLADMYLWKASNAELPVGEQKIAYEKCYVYAQKAIDAKRDIYTKDNIPGVNLTKLIDKKVLNKYGYPLLAEIETEYSDVPAAYNQIFGDGYSFESIFENAAYYGNVIVLNYDFAHMFGSDNAQNQERTYMLADGNVMLDAPTGTTFNLSLFPTATDMRSISSFSWKDAASFDVNKYCGHGVSTKYEGKSTINYKTAGIIPTHSIPSKDNAYHNFVFYRLSEMLLFQAEAEIEYAKLLGDAEPSVKKDSLSAKELSKVPLQARTSSELLADAMNLICATYVRSNPYANNVATALPTSKDVVQTVEDYETCLMQERRREFLFEGKRYYDLVRQARREGNQTKFVNALLQKYADGGASIAIKLRKKDFMYMPILKKQIQINPKLKQNSAYLDEETLENN